ncbi:recombinase family protein [Filimonas effusa]|uniref:recombinase family protein n=1 Tax=Filimonas effusa TaxID=2508721 RepID=UPI0013E99A45|nr:recombinase family protein [Filimonas effusa]
MKKGIRYLRFSSDGQSQHSIERQDAITGQWMNYNNVQISDSFIDEGHTARNFDRPDIKKLFDFIKKNYHGIDYLVVSELTRFSREAGDAINMVKQIQSQYGVRIVSAGRGSIYDCLDHNSFFMMGLEFLLGNSENIKRQNDINSGIYTGKAIKGKYIHSWSPFGYEKEGAGETRRLVRNASEAHIVEYIYKAFLADAPLNHILKEVRAIGFKHVGNSAIQRILSNPVYAGYQNVKPYKELPGGLFPIKEHDCIIDYSTWHLVQQKLNKKDKPKISLSDEIPLRGVLKCHCGRFLTGAPSRGRHGGYFYYYKCNQPKHNNISAKKSHQQIVRVFELMSIPKSHLQGIRIESEKMVEMRLAAKSTNLRIRSKELHDAEAKLASVEEKWISNKITHDTYERWYNDLNKIKISAKSQIARLNQDEDQLYELLNLNLDRLTDLGFVYESASTIQKQGLINKGFDSNLYYKNGIYRTPTILKSLSHNILKMKEEGVLEMDKNEKGDCEVPPGGAEGSRTPVQT